MKELSLNILDVAENSVKAKATLTEITVFEDAETLSITIADDGCGMDENAVKNVCDPFYTTRTTRDVGLGIPLFKMEAEQTGGEFSIVSRDCVRYPDNHGTVVTARFNKNHIDFIPLGDVVSTVTTLIQGHPETDFLYRHQTNGNEVTLDTRELKTVLGDEVPLSDYEVIKWIEEFLKEQYQSLI